MEELWKPTKYLVNITGVSTKMWTEKHPSTVSEIYLYVKQFGDIVWFSAITLGWLLALL